MKNRSLIHAKELKKKTAAKQNPATLERDRTLDFCMRDASCSRGLPAKHKALTCACARLEVTAELHVDKVATQAVLQLLKIIKATA